MGRVFAIIAAILFHGAFLLFGGALFRHDKENHGTIQTVDLLTDEAVDDKNKKDDKKETPEDKKEQETVESETEPPPDASEVMRNLEITASAPALEAASLGAIEAALNPNASGGGAFAEALTFASGGRIGGTGKAVAALADKLEDAFSLGDIDQKPRAVFQSSPNYPAELRSKKIEGSVQVVFIVETNGRVINARIEKSSHPAFEKPALEAVQQWKFEPAVKGGERVRCKMRAPIRFQPS